MKLTTNATDGWRLGERQRTSVGEVAYEVFGEGPPVILVHGTPTRSYLWRNMVPALAESRSVYVYDLLGYGESEMGKGQDVSKVAQARLLGELIEVWGLDAPAIAGHDIGGGIVLRAHLLEEVSFSRIAVLDAVVLTPSLSEPRSSTWHVREYAGAYEAMPDHLFGAFFSAYLEETNSNLGEEAFETYLAPWRGEEGRRAFVRQALQFEEWHTGEIEPRLGSIGAPVLVVWGEEDGWLDSSQAPRLQEEIPGSKLEIIPRAGHFVQEDAPEEVAEVLVGFFSGERSGRREPARRGPRSLRAVVLAVQPRVPRVERGGARRSVPVTLARGAGA
jgi:pimeloyl-ACP methyl ester carboxylesterase